MNRVSPDGRLNAMDWTPNVRGMDLMRMGQRHQAYTPGYGLACGTALFQTHNRQHAITSITAMLRLILYSS